MDPHATYAVQGGTLVFGGGPVGVVKSVAAAGRVKSISKVITVGPISEPAPNFSIGNTGDTVFGNVPRIDAVGNVKFQRWSRGDAIDKPLPDGSVPSWKTVRERYWKNRSEASKNSGEFSRSNLRRMNKGNAPQFINFRTGNLESMELHHHNPQRYGGLGVHNPFNLREVTPDQHRNLDPYRY